MNLGATTLCVTVALNLSNYITVSLVSSLRVVQGIMECLLSNFPGNNVEEADAIYLDTSFLI
jgi:hypothetical protein